MTVFLSPPTEGVLSPEVPSSSHYLDLNAEHLSICMTSNVSYTNRVNNPGAFNYCLVPEGGPDAVFFAALAIFAMAMASPRWDAIIVLLSGAVYEAFAYTYNLGHVSNAASLWLGMRPADIFVYVFLPPFLFDASIRIDFFMLKKRAVDVIFMAFVMVACITMILIPFMLYALDLESLGWTANNVALFGACIASTDAAAVAAVLNSGGAPEILSVLLEGESLFNDASSLTLFEIFNNLVQNQESQTVGQEIADIVTQTLWSAFTGICIGIGTGMTNHAIFYWLEERQMEAPAHVAFTVGGAYLSFYITQVWCNGSGCIGTVVYGLYGSATLLYGMSNKARVSNAFPRFWQVLVFIINALIFFYVGASSVNFTVRSGTTLYENGIQQLLKDTMYRLPLIWLTSFALRGIFLFVSLNVLKLMGLSDGLSWQEIVFVTVGGLRGGLSLVLAQAVAANQEGQLSATQQRVNAETAIFTAGYVILTLIINAPLCGPLMTALKLDRISEEQIQMRRHVKELFSGFCKSSLTDLQAEQDEEEMLQGVDWAVVAENVEVQRKLDKKLPETQPTINLFGWARCFCAPFTGSSLNTTSLMSVVGMPSSDAAVDLVEVAKQDKRKQQQIKEDLKRSTMWNFKEGAANPSLVKESQGYLGSNSADKLGQCESSGTGILILGEEKPFTSFTKLRRKPSLRRTDDVSKQKLQHHSTKVGIGSMLNSLKDDSTTVPTSSLAGLPKGRSGRFTTAEISGPSGRGLARTVSLRRQGSLGPGSHHSHHHHHHHSHSHGHTHKLWGNRMGSLFRKSSKPLGNHVDGSPHPSRENSFSVPVVPTAGASLEDFQGAIPQHIARLGHHADSSNLAGNIRMRDQSTVRFVDSVSGDDSLTGSGTTDTSNGSAMLPPPPAPPPPAAAPPPPSSLQISSSSHPGSVPPAESPGGMEVTSHGESPTLSPFKRSLNPSLLVIKGASKFGACHKMAQPKSMAQQQTFTGGGGAEIEPAASDLATLSRGMKLVQRVGRGGVDSFVEAINLGSGGSGRVPGRGSVVAPPSLGSRSRGASVAAAAAAAAEAWTVPPFESPPGHEMDGLSGPYLGVSLAAQDPGEQQQQQQGGSTRPLSTRSVGPTTSRLDEHSESGMKTTEEAAAGRAAERSLRRNEASASGNRPLGASSVGFPGGSGRRDWPLASDQQPVGRKSRMVMGGGMATGTSVAQSSAALAALKAAAPAGSAIHKRNLSRGELPVFESPPGHELDGLDLQFPVPSLRVPAGERALGTRSVSAWRDPGAEAVGSAAPFVGGRYQRTASGGERALGTRSVGFPGFGLIVDSHQASTLGQSGNLARSSVRSVGTQDAEEGNIPLARGSMGNAPLGRGSVGSTTFPLGRGSVGNLTTPHPLRGSGLKRTSPSPVGSAQDLVALEDSNAANNRVSGLKVQSLTTTSIPVMPHALAHHATIEEDEEMVFHEGGHQQQKEDDEEIQDKYGSDASPEDLGEGKGMPQMLPEYRMRLLTGLKQYYKRKFEEGILSAKAFKILSYCCNAAHHHAEEPVKLWQRVKQEISMAGLLQTEVRTYYSVKGWHMAAKASKNTLYRILGSAILVVPVWLLSFHLNKVTIVGLETAAELWMSLTDSSQTQWLEYSGFAGEMLLDEVLDSADSAWEFVIEKRIEVPETFQAIQTYRASVTLLSHQKDFVTEMNSGGMIGDKESEKILEVLEQRLQSVRRDGPQWRRQSVRQILSNTPFLRGIDSKVVEWVRQNSVMRMYGAGDVIWQPQDVGVGERSVHSVSSASSQSLDLFVVINGVVRLDLEVEGKSVPMYLGAGGVGGLMSLVLGGLPVPGMTVLSVHAEGTAMGKGPVVLFMPKELFAAIRHFSRVERLMTYQLLEVQIYRSGASFVLDMLRHQVTSQLGAFIRGAMQDIVCNHYAPHYVNKRERRSIEGPHAAASGQLAKRQRLRSLLRDITLLDGEVGGYDWVGELLEMNAAAAFALLERGEEVGGLEGEGIEDEGWLAGGGFQAWHEQMFRAIAAATSTVYDEIRQAIKESVVVVLSPGQAVLQQCTMVLISGSLLSTGDNSHDMKHSHLDGSQQGGASGSRGVPLPSEAVKQQQQMSVFSQNEDHVAPSVLVWTSDYFGMEAGMQEPVRIRAGASGASLMVWGADAASMLVQDIGSYLMGAPDE